MKAGTVKLSFLTACLLVMPACASKSVSDSPWPLPSQTYVSSIAASFRATLSPAEKEQLRYVNFLKDDPANLELSYSAAVRFIEGTRAGRKFCGKMLLLEAAESWWCARAILVAAASDEKKAIENLIAVLVGTQIERLDSKMPYVDPPSECTGMPRPQITGWENPGDTAWFRTRSAFWVKCSDGKYKTYLPERGWFNPPNDFKPD